MTRLFVLVPVLFLVSSISAEFRVRLDASSARSSQRPVGAQVAVMCSITGLDIDLRPGMTWIKEGGNIASTGNVIVSKLDNFHLSMIINNGSIEDSGIYTCRASYEDLRFANDLQPIDAKANDNVNISCLVTPARSMKPKVLWQKGNAAITKGNKLWIGGVIVSNSPLAQKLNGGILMVLVVQLRFFCTPRLHIGCLCGKTQVEDLHIFRYCTACLFLDSPRNYKFLESDQVLQIPKFDPVKDNGKYSCKVVDTRTGAVLNREVEIGGPRKNNREELCSTLCSSLCGSQRDMPKH